MMNRLRSKISALLISAVSLVAVAGSGVGFNSNYDLRRTIDSTDTYLARRAGFDRAKEAKIQNARLSLSNATVEDSGGVMIELGREFRRSNIDSAAHYFREAAVRAESRGDSAVSRTALLELAAVNPLRGIIKESVDMFEAVDESQLTPEELAIYFDKGFEVYFSIAAFYGDDPHGNAYLRKAIAYSDSLVNTLPAGSAHKLYHKGWSALQHGDRTTALAELRSALSQLNSGDELYARVAASLADYYNEIHDTDKAAYYLALSVISDIAAGTKETTSLQRLGLDLYERGDINRAHRYMTIALDNSLESGSKVRTFTEMQTLPVVSKAYNDKDASRIRLLYILVGILSAALIAAGVMAYIIYRSKQRLAAYRLQLTKKNLRKDAYINQILAICSSYIERIEDLNRLVLRKVKAGQSQDLCRMAESGEMLREQSDKFLRAFDQAFLSVYPHFVDQLNLLLRPDTRFAAPDENKLTPELRIAAFMRLGICDSAKIARLLGLSLNTVYTYRNKLRNRAADRDNFESSIQKIGESFQ